MGVNSTGRLGSSDVAIAAQMWGPGMIQSIGAGATLTQITNCGITYFTSGTTAAALYSIAAPVAGVSKTLVFMTSSTLITLNTTAATIIFQGSSLAVSAGVGSTALVVTGAATGNAAVASLVGLSTTQWVLTSRMTNVIST